MHMQVSNMRWSVGTVLISSVLLFGVYGIVNALGEDETYQPDEIYVEECGACHLAYAPGLLPAKSWLGIMENLEDHFEDNAELDDETSEYLVNYLEGSALKVGEPSKMSKLLRNMSDQPPLRITELTGFVQAHESVYEELAPMKLPVGFLSPCADCHRQADQALFDKELLGIGYGPTFK